MMKLVMVGVGGALGAMCRYLVYLTSLALIKKAWLPYGTIFVNLAGCLAIGFLGGLAETRGMFGPELRALVFIGFLGGFTTFSTLGFEVFTFIRNGQVGMAILDTAIQVCFGVLLVWLGFVLAK